MLLLFTSKQTDYELELLTFSYFWCALHVIESRPRCGVWVAYEAAQFWYYEALQSVQIVNRFGKTNFYIMFTQICLQSDICYKK